MQYAGTRSEPSVKNLVIVVVMFVVIAVYTIISVATGDWLWFSGKFAELPNDIHIYCYGETINLDPNSFHFKKLSELMNELMSGRKRWDDLSLSQATYQEYQTNPKMVVVEFFYTAAVRVHTSVKYFSAVNNLIVPLEGRHAQTQAIFGQNGGLPAAGSLHVESTKPLSEYLRNQELCPVSVSSK